MIAIVRKAKFPFLADWFAISLRWLALLALTSSLVFLTKPDLRFLPVLGAAAIWNSFITLLAINNQRLPYHQLANVCFDLLVSLALFILSGGLSGPLAWSGFLVLLSAAIYYEWRGSLFTSLLVSFLEAAATVLIGDAQPFNDFLIPLGFLTALNLGLGALLGLLALPLITELRRRYQAALYERQETERKAHLQERLLEMQEEARKQLARELHDGPTQSVTALGIRINIARRMLAENPSIAMEELAHIEELAFKATREIRHMLFTLRPLTLETQGLIAALQAMSDKMKDTYQKNVLVDVDPGVIDKLDSSVQTVIFYLVDEAVSNACKHADAEQITISLKFQGQDNDQAFLEVADNGKGFDVHQVSESYDQRGSLGLVNLQERANLINAHLAIESSPGMGTSIRVDIPLKRHPVHINQRQLITQL